MFLSKIHVTKTVCNEIGNMQNEKEQLLFIELKNK